MEQDLFVRILGLFLILLGGTLLYYSIVNEEKLRNSRKKENGFGANYKRISGSVILIIVGIVLLWTGKYQ